MKALSAEKPASDQASDLDLRVRYELLRMVYSDQPISLVAALVYAVGVAAVMAAAVPGRVPWIWLGAIALIIGGRFWLALAFRRAQPRRDDYARWQRRFFAGAVAMGGGWGAIGWHFYPIVPEHYRVVVIMIVGGIVTASSRSIATQLPTFCAFAVCAIGPLVLRHLQEPPPRGTFMSVFMIIFLSFMIGIARNFRDTIARSFRLSLENAALAEKLQRDIAAREAAEQALRASEGQLQLVQYALDHASDLVAVMDERGALLHVSQALCRFTGCSPAELRALPAWELLRGSRTEFLQRWADVKARGSLMFETTLRTRSGEFKSVEVNASHVEINGRAVVCAIARDLGPRRAADQEKERIARQLQEAQRLESLGVLAGGVAHDFNNLLTGVLGNATLARSVLTRQPEVADMLAQIERAAGQAAGLCRQLLAYAGKGRFAVEPVDLSAMVNDSARLLEMSAGRRARLELRLDPTLPRVLADISQMRQVVLSLVQNAAEAIERDEGLIVVSMQRVTIDRALAAGARIRSEIAEGEGVALEVTDNGGGMDAATLERIFEPFFTTKFTGRGLGLPAVMGIVRSHAGLLFVRSAPGAGTTFRLVFAAVRAEQLAVIAPAEAPPAAPRKRARVLVVDDEESVRVVARQSLEWMGFQVETAPNGEAALAMATGDKGCFDLVLIDMSMPRVDGVRAVQELRRAGVTSRLVLMSGFSAQEARVRAGEAAVDAFLQKPFDLDTLRSTIDLALAGPPVIS